MLQIYSLNIALKDGALLHIHDTSMNKPKK